MKKTNARSVLIIGGYGVFGGYLAQRLSAEGNFRILVGGRSLSKAMAFCASHSAEPLLVDRNSSISELATIIQKQNVDIVVDASGPFDFKNRQSYSVPSACIKAECHYIDLADDADFVANISLLNDEAKNAGVVILAGASSVPALSSAAIDAISSDMKSIDSIEIAILPGNKAPRGFAVVQSILGQAGKTFAIFKNGKWQDEVCWGSLSRCDLNIESTTPINHRWASPIKVPDILLFPDKYNAKTVTFKAGLELPIMHLGLWLLAKLVSVRLLKSIRPLSTLTLHLSNWLKPFGTDRGGMTVKVTGHDFNGHALARNWTLIAEAGDGPQIPAIPAYILCKKIAAHSIASGACPAISVFSLNEALAAMQPFAIKTAINSNAHIHPRQT